MCGIAGFWQAEHPGCDEMAALARRMAAAIPYRGPDDSGEWVDAAAGVALSHRRLAIVDLSAEGRGPMASASGRYWITYNGEVYNAGRLRRELEVAGHRFRGHSDTEVMLAAIEEYGAEAAIARFVGMFAFALWDRQARQLLLVRDRVGIKPLFVYQRHGTVIFGSELRALREHPVFVPDVDRRALLAYVRYRYVPEPRSIFNGAVKLLPGHVLRIDDPSRPLPAPTPYWSPVRAAASGLADPLAGSAAEVAGSLSELLQDVVDDHLLADVPVGAFLSGGVDSSVVVALMQRQRSRPVRTFSIGSDAVGYDESSDAAKVAAFLGTDHTALNVSSSDALDVLPSLGDIFDEPFADVSQIPTFLVSRLARGSVTVSLSGDGGDELFGGYTRYQWVPQLWRQGARLPGALRQTVRVATRLLAPGTWNQVFAALAPVLPRAGRVRLMGDKLQKLAAVEDFSSPDAVYRAVASALGAPGRVLTSAPSEVDDHLLSALRSIPFSDPVDRMMLCDLMTYLPGDILTKLDRCSMAVSLEGRVPLLDHRVIEFAWRIPRQFRFEDGRGKWPLRKVLGQFIPSEFVDRPKAGFDVPLDAWLRGPLRDWACDLLAPARLRQTGLFDGPVVERLLHDHLSGRRNNRDVLWTLLMFETWRERWRPSL
jgi:asparagine synthase (glutamine-hydrolysing)